MPHRRMAIHRAVRDANTRLERPEYASIIGAASSLEDLASQIEMTSAGRTAVGMLHPELQDVILSAIKSAAAAGRPVNLTWKHGLMQGVHVSSPGPGEFPIDIEIHTRFDEDGLGPPATS